ncbi:hypothetical protein [Kitasatospora sp. NPDC093679]|uniref:hypothetical protein n=1 Tax=Kitasatospora sp. NPDC093679 TaxID=3154983 RepID=UPI00341FBC3C
MTAITAVTTFILTEATDTDLQRLDTAMRDRRKALAEIRAAAVVVGAAATTRNLSPKYMNGLSGTVESIQGKVAYLKLDEHSTEELRAQYSRRFPVPDGVKTYSLPAGIPLTCLTVTAS